MASAYVSDFSFAVGEQTFTVEESSSAGRTISAAALLRTAGFATHRICSQSQSSYDLAAQAVDQVREKLRGVGAIIYATCLPQNSNMGDRAAFIQTGDVKYLMDFPASHLQSDFGLTEAQVYGLTQQACTGMLGSMHLASALLAADEGLTKVLCLTADRFPEGAVYEQAYNLISDGAAVCIVSRKESGLRLIAHHGVTNGAMASASDDETVGSFFNYSYAAIKQTLDKAKLTIDDIAWIVPQNTNRTAWTILANLLGANFSQVHCPTLQEYGHLISGDNIINLQALEQSGQLKPGQRVLLFMAGFGLNWQCLILEKVATGG